MESYIYGEQIEDATIALLIKQSALNDSAIKTFYLNKTRIPNQKFAAVSLYYNPNNKITAIEGKAYIKSVLDNIKDTNIDTLFVADSNYFKFLTKKQKVKDCRGYVFKCVLVGYEHLNVVLSTNYMAITHNPNNLKDLDLSIQALEKYYSGDVQEIGTDIIKKAFYPSREKAAKCFNRLHSYHTLTSDIESYSLRFEKAGIATIGFAWNKHEGAVFDISFEEGKPVKNEQLILLREFLETYEGTLIFHNILYEIKIFVYWLFMEHDSDWAGMRRGLDVISKFDDTMIMAYLCTNNTIDNQLGLKELAYEYTGAYSIDVKDIRLHAPEDLKEYNLVDCLGTYYVYDKYAPMLKDEEQNDYYYNFSKPFIKPAAKMMLTGLPMDMGKVHAVKRELEKEFLRHRNNLLRDPNVQKAMDILATNRWKVKNAKLKTKIAPYRDFIEMFNPNSDPQKEVLLYDVLKLPVLDTTDSGAPSTSTKVLLRLLDHPQGKANKDIINTLIGVSQVSIIISTFINAFIKYRFVRNTPDEFNGTSWLNGNLKTTGTKSGRLSSSEPNMQNLPSGSKYGEMIKSCFVAPKGWVICGADFAALEDRINTIKTADPNKIKVYTDGYDGHSLRAHTYYGHEMPDIDANSVESINSIQDLYSKKRSRSKSPTFAMQYGGTYRTLMKNLGFSEEEAHSLESNYKSLYRISFEYAEAITRETAVKGYIELAFGLKLRAPKLSNWNLVSRLSNAQAAESRTVNNADSQSYGQLMNRAIVATEEKLEQSEFVEDILILNTIHDAVYYLVKLDSKPIKWLNDNLISEMEWQEDKAIYHPEIPMTAELDVGFSWDKQKTLHNNATIEEIDIFLEEIQNE